MLVELSFSQLSYEVIENEASVTFMILLSQVSSNQFEVEVSTMDVTATGIGYKCIQKVKVFVALFYRQHGLW